MVAATQRRNTRKGTIDRGMVTKLEGLAIEVASDGPCPNNTAALQSPAAE
jgi:hypothetical protein